MKHILCKDGLTVRSRHGFGGEGGGSIMEGFGGGERRWRGAGCATTPAPYFSSFKGGLVSVRRGDRAGGGGGGAVTQPKCATSLVITKRNRTTSALYRWFDQHGYRAGMENT